ncbi:MAG: hypothetical protein ACM35G_13175, partial [Planctomycetaceae bacterium]
MDPKHLGWCGGISSIVGGPTPCAGQANGRNKGMETTALTDAAKRRATVRIRIKFRNLRGERGREAWIYADWGIGPKRFDWVTDRCAMRFQFPGASTRPVQRRSG